MYGLTETGSTFREARRLRRPVATQLWPLGRWARLTRARAVLAAPVLLGLLLVAFGAVSPATAAAACANPIACENALPGDPPSDWQVQGAGDPTIQGYATSFSVNVGQTETFKINTPSTNYHIDILRLGYYGGDGARIVQANIKPTAKLPQTQPACLTDSSTGLIDCGNWSVSASWTVPSTAVSGVYIAHLERDDSQDPGGESQIPFVVRNDASHSQMPGLDVRRDVGGVQRLRRQQPLHVHRCLPARQPARLQGGLRRVLQPPV